MTVSIQGFIASTPKEEGGFFPSFASDMDKFSPIHLVTKPAEVCETARLGPVTGPSPECQKDVTQV